MTPTISTRYPNGVETYCVSYDNLNEILAKDSTICPGSTVSDYLKFSPNSLREYLNKNTDIDWTNCKFYHDEVVVGA